MRDILQGGGYEVQINRPYAGGFITEYYGNPPQGIQCLQLEINRALYLDETTLSKSKNFPSLARTLATLAAQVFAALPALLERRAAAE
jgi:N-formylglutamate amidohydrolase